MNLELPFPDVNLADLDEALARIDRDLDALFLDDVAGTVERLGDAPPSTDSAAM